MIVTVANVNMFDSGERRHIHTQRHLTYTDTEKTERERGGGSPDFYGLLFRSWCRLGHGVPKLPKKLLPCALLRWSPGLHPVASRSACGGGERCSMKKLF